MADTYKKISDFTKATAFGDDDLLLVSQSGTTKAIKGSVLKAFATAAGIDAAKINDATVNGSGHLIIKTTDGTSIDVGKVTGSDGVSVTGASIDSQYHLILTLSDGTTKDAGYCRGASGSGTGDMLKETYDEDGAVEAAGGIVGYVDQLAQRYDPNWNIIDDGGIEAYCEETGLDVAETVAFPVGTIVTTVKGAKDKKDEWLKCDGSEFSADPYAELWQLLATNKSDIAWNVSPQLGSNLTNRYISNAYRVGDDYFVESGMSGNNAVLNIYHGRWYYSTQTATLEQSFTATPQESGTFPCSVDYYNGLLVVWSVNTSSGIKMYHKDGDTWSEKPAPEISGIAGHRIDVAVIGWGAAYVVLCDCDTGLVYASSTPFVSTSWKQIADPPNYDGCSYSSGRVSQGYGGTVVARTVTRSGSSEKRCVAYEMTDPFDTEYWVKICDHYDSNTVYSKFLYYGDRYIRAFANGASVCLTTYKHGQMQANVWLSTADDSTAITQIDLEPSEVFPNGLAIQYSGGEDSTEYGGTLMSLNLDAGFFQCPTGTNGIPKRLFFSGSTAVVVTDTGSIIYENYAANSANLPNISLSDDTTTYIRAQSSNIAYIS